MGDRIHARCIAKRKEGPPVLKKVAVVAVLSCSLAPVPAAAQAQFCAGREATIVGTDGRDVIEGTRHADIIAALGASDVVDGGGGNDLICDGSGKDVVRGGRGDDVLLNSEGSDGLRGGRGNDRVGMLLAFETREDSWDHLRGGRGNDRLSSSAEQFRERYHGGPGVDTLDLAALSAGATVDLEAGTVVGAGESFVGTVENVSGSAFSDVIAGDDGPNVLFGGDIPEGFFGPTHPPGGVSDTLRGRGGDDDLDGGTGDDTISGDEGADWIHDALGRDAIDAGAGGDVVSTAYRCEASPGQRCTPPREAYSGDDVDGGAGDDVLTGGFGDDLLSGAEGSEFLLGGDGADDLRGEDDTDSLRGGDGRDSLDGGPGIDTADFGDAPAGVTVDLAAATVAGGSDDLLTGIESAAGSAFDDVLLGSGEPGSLEGRDGDDLLRGLGGDDFLDGGDGEDELYGAEGNDVLDGGAAPRYLGHNMADGRRDLQDGGPGDEDSCFASELDELVDCELLMVE